MITHIVKSGDCLSTIAAQYGFRRWQTIYNAPENDSFRQKRPNPNVIYPGDEVVIPDKQLREESRNTEKKHRFRAPAPAWVLRVRILDETREPIANAPFTLDIEGERVLEDSTGDDGLFAVEVPAGARSGSLHVLGESVDLNIGHLDPVSVTRGLQQRLNNLALNAGPVDGIMGERTRSAIAAFQSQEGLDRTGSPDDETRKQLLKVHDNDDKVPPNEQEAVPPGESFTDTGGQPADGGYESPDDVIEPTLPDQWDPPSPPDALNLSNSTQLIRGTQQRLTALGFDPGPIDGLDGPLTQAAVREFQQYCSDHAEWPDPNVIDSGPVDGIVGPKTKAALESWYGC